MTAFYGGIDLHSNNSVVVVIDDAGEVVYRRRLANDLQHIEKALAPYREALSGVVVESTYNWYWLVDGLMAAGYPMQLAHPTATQPYSGLKHTDDESDAQWLGGWRSCCAWASCPRATSIRRRSRRCAICCASVRSWCVSARRS